MAVRTIAALSPVTDSMVVTTATGGGVYTTERLGEVSTVRRAQPFFATHSYLSNVTFRKGGETGTFVGTVKVSIQGGTTNSPSGTDLVSYTYTNAAWKALALDTNITLTLRTPMTVGNIYFIVWTSSTADNSNYSRLYAHRDPALANTAGSQIRFDGSSWATSGGAKYFKITSGPAYYTEITRTTVTRTAITQPRVATRDMGTALRFDGTSNVVSIGLLPTLLPNMATGSFSFSTWLKTGNSLSQSLIGTTNTGTSTLFSVFLNRDHTDTQASGKVFIQIRDTAARVYRVSNTTAINFYNNRPNQLTVVCTPSQNTAIIAINGIPLSTTNGNATGPTSFTTFDFSMAIGARNQRGVIDSFFQGIIDEPRIWNRALSAQEIANMYFNNVVPRNGLVGEYLFNETIGTTTLDSSGNGNDGTITGATYMTDVPRRERTSI
jgi:hypothetical protein